MRQATESEFNDLIAKYTSGNYIDQKPENIFAFVVSERYSLLTASSVISKIFDLTLSESRNISQNYWEKNIKARKEDDIKLFMEAMEQYHITGASEVKCDVCASPIIFTDLGEVFTHKCQCGKFNGTLK